MQEVKIFDYDFNLIASDFKCISFDWEVKFNSIGSFEGVFTIDSPVYDACSKNEFTVCVQGENQGIVTGVNIKDDRIVIQGKSMNYILEKRICMPFFSGNILADMPTATEMVNVLVKQCCGDFMEVMPAPELEVRQNFIRLEARPLSEIIIEILRNSNCGHFVKFDVDQRKWVFGCLLPNYTEYVLSRPDNTLEDCDYVRRVNDTASCGIYKQKMQYMGTWNAAENKPALTDYNPENFAKAYLISKSGEMFNKNYEEGKYLVCTDLSGELKQANSHDDFWFKVYTGEINGPLRWECMLPCRTFEEAYELLLLKEIDENVIATTRGVKQRELKPGDVVEIRFTSGKNAVTFTKQVKKVVYHYEWNNCFVRPTFYRLKENEDE